MAIFKRRSTFPNNTPIPQHSALLEFPCFRLDLQIRFIDVDFFIIATPKFHFWKLGVRDAFRAFFRKCLGRVCVIANIALLNLENVQSEPLGKTDAHQKRMQFCSIYASSGSVSNSYMNRNVVGTCLCFQIRWNKTLRAVRQADASRYGHK